MSKTIYLAGPMDKGSDTQNRLWRVIAREELSTSKHVGLIIDPYTNDPTGWRENERDEARIINWCKENIRQSDIILAKLDGEHSGGTAMEMALAHEWGKSIIGWTEGLVDISPWFTYHCGLSARSLDEAVHYAKAIAMDLANRNTKTHQLHRLSLPVLMPACVPEETSRGENQSYHTQPQD